MRRFFLTILLLTVAAVGLAQPPAPPPPVVPAGGAPVPADRPPVPLAAFEPLAAYPLPTQSAVRSVLLGSGWLTRANQANGRFQYGYLPALRLPMEGDDDAAQAAAALALARAARFAGDERQAVVAGQAVLSLLAMTKLEADGTTRTPRVAQPVPFAAYLAMAIQELPGADDKLLGEAYRLCHFLRAGIEPAAGRQSLPPEQIAVALHAVAANHRLTPATWKSVALSNGIARCREAFKAAPSPQLANALVPVAAEMAAVNHPQSAEATAAAFELTDWLLALQYPATDARFPLRAGGFKGFADGQPVDAPPPAVDTGRCLEAVAAAYQLNRQAADLGRAARYRQAAQDAAQYLCGLQYAEANTRHFENGFRANVLIGGFYLSPADGNLRLDASAAAVAGLCRLDRKSVV